MTTVSILIPFRSDGAEREVVFRRVLQTTLDEWPDTQVLWGDNKGSFNRSASRNALAFEAAGRILVFLDADSWVPPDQIAEAVRRIGTSQGAWCFPFDRYYALSPSGSTQVWMNQIPEEGPDYEFVFPGPDPVDRPPSVGGCLVVDKSTFFGVHGYDERFIGWGEEDRAIFLALKTLVHPEVRIPGDLYHYWHPHPDEECFDQPHFRANQALCNRYREAEGNKDLMSALVREHP